MLRLILEWYMLSDLSQQNTSTSAWHSFNETSARSEEMQTLRAGCSKAEPKIFTLPQTPFSGVQDNNQFNQLEMVTTLTCKPSLVRIDARNFELSR